MDNKITNIQNHHKHNIYYKYKLILQNQHNHPYRMLLTNHFLKINLLIKLVLINIYINSIGEVSAHRFTCQFDHLYGNRSITPGPNDKPDQLFSDEHYFGTKRRLQAVVRNAIRITLDTTDFNSIKTTTNGETQTTTVNLSFLRKTMLVVQTFYQTRLKVSTVSRIFAPSTCLDFNPSSNDVSNGISASDLHIYVRYVTDNTATFSYAATGASCKYITSRTLPDATFQQGRPTVGRIIFNTYNTVDRQTSLTNRLFAQITMTSLHQTMHILGFDSSLYSSFLNPSTGNIYSYAITESVSLNAGRTGGNNYILKTPSVVDWAKDFYACSGITGMALENQQTTPGVGSHWQRLSMYDQLMTATQLGPQKGFSGLTFALLKDMGWYEVDASFNDTSNYGYHLGCGFYFGACYDTTTYSKYFCNMASYSGVSTCSTNFLGKAVCTNQAGAMADGCGILGGYFHCVDPAQSDDGYKSYTLQRYETDSLCIQSTFANLGLSNLYKGRCYRYKCFTSYIEFYINANTVTCQSSENGVQKTLNSISGYLQCPKFVDFCQQSRKICPNWCSQNGVCTRGICNCLPGYYGADCSKTICTSGQYYDQTRSMCVSTCPSGTYTNKYSVSCLACASTCQQCRDQPTICTGCLTTPANPLYFVVSQSLCVSECPNITYQDGDYCRDCDSTISFCGTCQYIQTNCTSCVGGKFLQNPFYGSCVSSCSGTYSLYDVVNFKCVSTCTNNLVYYAGSCTACPNPTDGNCDLCANGTYKYIGDQQCHVSCPSTYYQNNVTRFCQKCDLSCKQCDGAYPENCTECLSSSNNKYLLLARMCVSKCPLGFYANDNSGSCQLCPPSLNCATCKLQTDGVTIVCLTCRYGFYLQTNLSCTTGCDFAYYKNLWKYTCDPCSSDCGNCTTGASSSCIDCRSGKVFLGNISGKYCLADCPIYYYYRSGTNCLDCYSTCKTCNGVNSNNCLTCVSGLFLSSGMCRYVCPSGTYPRASTGLCQSCNPSCTFCFGPTIDNCTSCTSSLVLDNYTCTTSCSGGLTVNQWGVCHSYLVFFNFLAFLVLIVQYL